MKEKGFIEPLIFERSRKGRTGVEPLFGDAPLADIELNIPFELLRDADGLAGFPEVSELDVVRHYTRLSKINLGIDSSFYPLGSCTMKYNPKVNEEMAGLSGFAKIHPYMPEEFVQGALELMHGLSSALAQISGMDEVSLQPSAGAQGEFAGMLVVRAYFKDMGRPRKKVIIPDTAHGTNPASSMLAGFDVVPLKTGGRGIVSVEAVQGIMDEDTAALMLTNPNTLGLFERNIKEISEVVHAKGGFVYCDGANLNALMGIAKLGDMGVDLVQLNLHKTFSTPHGGGGPGSGPIGVKKTLVDYLPMPVVVKTGDKYLLDYARPKSIGRLRAFYGQFAVMVKAYSYIKSMGKDGLRKASEIAVLNANYIKERLKTDFHLPFDEPCMHECVFSDRLQSQYGITTMDMAKRLIDFGMHPPTVYFPLVVSGAMMVEPTETETSETLDEFIEAMKQIAKEAKETPALLKASPHTTGISRVDEVAAAREPRLRWRIEG
ncbi:MAG: aminomethyl-transferring glycine dehydrogenase subunit GcvPB [Deltaproteobacteria bacterium]|nr:aminomethyl-transferring glycine dehydrogenase subunit GcvPB [Deltaproteobacteria bacterium]